MNKNELKNKNKKGISSEKLNLIIAVCAMLVSVASFYATYLQANAANKQVKAMTLPLLQFSHGNYDSERQQRRIAFTIKNAGIGPAIVKTVIFKYKDIELGSLSMFLTACCEKEYKAHREFQMKLHQNYKNNNVSKNANNPKILKGMVSSTLSNVILPGQSEYDFLGIDYLNEFDDFWEKVNKERNSLRLKICYCSLLDECYITEKNGIYKEVDFCPV